MSLCSRRLPLALFRLCTSHTFCQPLSSFPARSHRLLRSKAIKRMSFENMMFCYSTMSADENGVPLGKMGPSRVRLRFTVDVEKLAPNEIVYVSGSIPSLGSWEPSNAMALQQDSQQPSRWHGFVDTSDEQVKFRYFIGYKLSSDAADRLVVSQWEAFLHPRSCLVRVEQRDGEARRQSVDIFGYYGMEEPLDAYGMKNEFKAGRRLVSEGWLQYDEENQILLRIHGNALKFYKADRSNCRIKCTPMDVRRKIATSLPPSTTEDEMDEDDDMSLASNAHPSHSGTIISVLSNDQSKFHEQKETGVTFNNGKDYIVFKTHSVATEFLAFLIEIFSEEGKRIGACYALPTSLNDTFGRTGLPFINSQGRPIGQITVEYLFVRNLRLPHIHQKMDVSYSRHWKKRNTLEVGHRGMGNSFTKFAMARENTVHSLNQAAQNGADFVEFDVQLTKDKVAVIYHDFHVLVSVAKRAPSIVDLSTIAEEERRGIDHHEIALKDLKLDQLRLLMVDHLKHKEIADAKKLVGDASENEDLKPFPRLSDALRRVDPDVGFNVEVKYPMLQKDGLHECDNYFERNEFVDTVLADILNYAGERRIMFSSFDPDICSLIAMKQNRYPCLFLCVGDTQRYTPFQDQRSSTSMTAVNFAAGIDILGVNFNSEDLLKDPRPVKRATDLGLVTFVWGDDLDKKEIAHYFKRELGVDGIIYDRIGEEERRRNVFTVEREQKKALFKVGSGSSTPRARSPNGAQSSSLPNSDQGSSSGSAPSTPPPSQTDSPLKTHVPSPRIQIQQS